MKKMFIYLMLFFSALQTFSQQKADSSFLSNDYLKKSKNQKTTAWILLGSGAALTVVGLAIFGGQDMESFNDVTSGEVIGAIGVVSAVASIPFFIASGKNKKKALSASANMGIQKISMLKEAGIGFQYLPIVSIKLAFGR